MKKELVIDALVTLTNGMESRTKIAQLRELYPYIEAAKEAGLKHSKIVETLNEQGFDLSLKTFEMLLYRIRKSKQERAQEPIRPAHPQKSEGAHHSPHNLRTHQHLRASTDSPNQVIEGLENLDKKQRRERLGDQFINSEVTNPLLKRIQDKNQ
jgi:hypothetical protein